MDHAPAPAVTPVEEALHAHRPLLWGLAYRLTGSAADADDVVQETFVRALEHDPPADAGGLARWLVRVATNRGIDLLRRRRRTRYFGVWLPAPLAGELEDAASPGAADPARRYDRRESASYAFLVALEVLTPRQRAVLLLRDVLGYSARETARTLDTSEGNVRITHHRARRAMRDYDQRRIVPTAATSAATQRALDELMRCLLSQDVAGLERLLAEGVRVTTDGGGEFNALSRPLAGRSRVVTFHVRVARRRAAAADVERRTVNGMPALLIRFRHQHPRGAPRALLRADLDPHGRIRELHWILASRKLAALEPDA